MKNTARNLILLLLFLVLSSGFSLAASEHTGHHPLSSGPSTSVALNPLIEEMTTLDAAFRDIVSAVALGDSERVRKALEGIHGAKEKTNAGIHEGTVTLPKNTARMKEFVELDRKFHDKLEALDRAARHNNLREMQRITNQLLGGCVQCHQTFRK